MFSRVIDQRLSRALPNRRPRPASGEWIALSRRTRPRRRRCAKLPLDFCSIAEALPHVGPEWGGPERGSSFRGLLACSMPRSIDGGLKRPHPYCSKTGRAKGFCESEVRYAAPSLILEL